ncbi:MAG: PfkB family carbohydrate kinase [Myxococcaceae bacterium]
MSLLVVGSVAFDSVETPFGKGDDVLGGSASYFSASASFFTQVSLIAVVGEDFPENTLDFLKQRGVDLSGLQRSKGQTFRWKGRYGYQLNEAQTLETHLNVFQSFSPELSSAHRKVSHVFLGNIAPELQLRVLDQVESPRLIAADTMNFWIEGSRAALLKTLAKVQLLFVNDAEARALAGEHNLVKAARAIQKMGPARVAIKRGEYGALLFTEDHVFACPAFPLEDVFDPTGAGDSFAGGFVGHAARSKTLTPEALKQAMVLGSTMASFAVERFSLDRMKSLSASEIATRYNDFKRLTTFSDLDISHS